jgi:cytochrome c-type biogenesis protein CcmF
LGGLALWVIFREWCRGTLARHRRQRGSYIKAFLELIGANAARYGGFLAHIGIIIVTLGIIASSFYGLEKTVTLDIGESVSVGKYELTYDELMFKQDNEKISAVAALRVDRGGAAVTTMYPRYAYWFSYDNFYAEVSVRTTAVEDLFASLVWTQFDPADKAATFRVLVNPLVVWIWVGGAFFLAGGILSFSYRAKQRSGGVN